MVAWVVFMGVPGIARAYRGRIGVMFNLLRVVATVCMLRMFSQPVRSRFGADEQKAKYKKQHH